MLYCPFTTGTPSSRHPTEPPAQACACPTVTMVPFGGLPIELVFHVFDLAAASSSECTLAISLVSSHARRLVHRYLFSTLAIRRPAPTSIHLCTAPYTRHLRYLWLENGTPFEEVPHTILFHIQETITHLALPTSLLVPIMNMPPSKWSHSNADVEDSGRTPRRLPCRELTVLRDDLSRPRSQLYTLPSASIRLSAQGTSFFHGITHVRLFARRDLLFLPLEHLRALTHVALPADPGELWDGRALEPRTSWLLQLQVPHMNADHGQPHQFESDQDGRVKGQPRLLMVVLVLQWFGGPLEAAQRRELALAARARDRRLFVAEAEGAHDERDAVKEWKRSVRGAGDSVWERGLWTREEALRAGNPIAGMWCLLVILCDD